VGVNKRPRTPRGPCRDSAEKTNNPTTTVGSAIIVFKKVIRALLPVNSLSAIRKLRGIPTIVAKHTALHDTFRETTVHFITSLSKEIISLRAVVKACKR
jgi:hypothetical protein